MTLTLICTACAVCGTEVSLARDQCRIDEIGENGERYQQWFVYPLPAARYRYKIAPDICDHCWIKHQRYMQNQYYHRKRAAPRPFNQLYLWEWVARQLEDQARRLTLHYARKARGGTDLYYKKS